MNSGKILAAEGLGWQVSPKVIFSSWSACLFNDQLFFNMSSYPLSSYMPFTCLHLYLPLTKNARLALLSILSGRVSLLTVNKELFYTWFISTCKIAAAYLTNSSSWEQVRDVNPILISSAFHSFFSVGGLKFPFGRYESKIEFFCSLGGSRIDCLCSQTVPLLWRLRKVCCRGGS